MPYWITVKNRRYRPGSLVSGRLHIVEVEGPAIWTLFLHCWEWNWTGTLDLRAAKKGGVLAFPDTRDSVVHAFAIRLPHDAQTSFRVQHGGIYWTCSAKLQANPEDAKWAFSGRFSVTS